MARLWSDVQDSKTPCAFVASGILQVLRGLTAGSQVTTYGRSRSGLAIVKLGGRESLWFVTVGRGGAASGCSTRPRRTAIARVGDWPISANATLLGEDSDSGHPDITCRMAPSLPPASIP